MWREAALGEVVTLQRGFDLPEDQRRSGNVPVVSSAGISGYHVSAKAKGPGVVTGRYGTLGKVYFVRDDFWPHNTTLFAKDFHGNNERFVYYLLTSLNLASHSAVSAVPGVNRNDLHRVPVLLPPLPIQRRIAEILGRLDDKIEVNRRINRTLESMAQALYRHWFVDFANPSGLGDPKGFGDELVESAVGLAPRGWEVEALADVVDLLSGGTPRTSVAEYWDGDIDWVSAKDVANSAPFIMATERKITRKGVDNSATKMLPAFTTVITARGTVGECGLLPWSMAMNQTNYGVRGKDGLGDFTTYLIVRDAVDRLRQHAYGTVFDTITRKTFEAIQVVLPPNSMLREFEAIIDPWFQAMLVNQRQNTELARTRDYLLPRLLAGDVEVMD